MSWRRCKGSVILRDTSSDRQGYKRDIRSLTRKSTFGKSFRIDAEPPKVSPVVKEPKPKFLDRCGNVIRKLQYNRTYRIRVTYSLCLVWVYMILGWTTGQLGPILLDLSLITNVSLEATATYIIILGVGYILGSFLGGMVYEKLSRPLTLFFTCLVLAAFEFTIPYCRQYWIMMIILFLDGTCEGAIDTIANTEMVSLWGKSIESWMQGMYFMFAVGAVISPLVTAPFLAPEITVSVSGVQSGSTSVTIFTLYDGTQTRIYLVYIINACLVLVAAALFFYQSIKNSIFLHGLSLPINDVQQARPLSKREKTLILLNMGILCFLYTAIEETFAEFLTIFCVAQMGMTKVQGSEATSLFFAAFGISRFVGIFLVTQLNPVRLICGYCVILILSFVGLTLAGLYYHIIGIWLFSPLIGIGLSIIYPILYTWTDENFIHITGKITAFLIIMASLGGMVNPALLGYLMEERSPMWFCYLLLVESLLFLLFYDVGLLLSRWIATKPNVRRLYNSEVEMETINENFGLDQRISPSPFDDRTGLNANMRLSSVKSAQQSSDKQQMETITEGRGGSTDGANMSSEIPSTSQQEKSSLVMNEESIGQQSDKKSRDARIDTPIITETSGSDENGETSKLVGTSVTDEEQKAVPVSDIEANLHAGKEETEVSIRAERAEAEVGGREFTDNSMLTNDDSSGVKKETIV
ncbi:sodium-dependent glucose transporter 1-like [Ylistrum balloti]|uniref:sodium-dependent glucose transporter 1-like n=1 Tax=Ylistrum balloti TaxID=509963 RepID=UPI002905B55D|nr:sodium-dependent glucose transporter 1-like [Ylistrum balloti]